MGGGRYLVQSPKKFDYFLTSSLISTLHQPENWIIQTFSENFLLFVVSILLPTRSPGSRHSPGGVRKVPFFTFLHNLHFCTKSFTCWQRYQKKSNFGATKSPCRLQGYQSRHHIKAKHRHRRNVTGHRSFSLL